MKLRQIQRFFHPWRAARALKLLLRPQPEHQHFLIHLGGVIHVGGHVGQERKKYARYALDVLWVEPDPDIFPRLQQNLRSFRKQRAVQALITETDDAVHTFHISKSPGSSSLLELGQLRDIWPEVQYVDHLEVIGVSLPTLIRRQGIDLNRYDGLVLDTQGTELSILRGAQGILRQFRYIKAEVADFESYKGCAQLPDLKRFLHEQGFAEIGRQSFAEHPDGGRYYDVVFKRTPHSGGEEVPAGL